MYFGGFLLRRPGAWPTWLAFRSTLTAASAIVVGWIVKTTALPAVAKQASELGTGGLASSDWLVLARDLLPFVGVPGLVLGIAAIAMRPFRPALALLAAFASVAAIIVIVGTLVASILPMYEMPADLG